MVFSEVLQDVAKKVDGWVGLVIMGMDGIPIEQLRLDETANFETLAAECTALLKNTRQASEEVGAGSLREITITTELLVILAVAITEDYVLLGVMRRGANHGRARFVMRRATLRLEKEFA
jgi:predicted regulator of Ras-like GTPase activity (Roadblock/LC7/MglB family)